MDGLQNTTPVLPLLPVTDNRRPALQDISVEMSDQRHGATRAAGGLGGELRPTDALAAGHPFGNVNT